jgi:hypothetical protein
MIENLTEDNFLEYAMDSYRNIQCHGIEEFYDDLLLIKYIKRLFRKYNETQEMEPIRLRLSLNHLIIFYNVFEREHATRILFFKLEPDLYPILKTFLVFLDLMPAIVHGIKGKNIYSKNIKSIKNIFDRLKNI